MSNEKEGPPRFEMTLNYRVMVEGYPNLKEEVGGSNPGYEISSLLDGKLARWSTASCAWRWTVGLLSQKKEKKGRPHDLPKPANGRHLSTPQWWQVTTLYLVSPILLIVLLNTNCKQIPV